MAKSVPKPKKSDAFVHVEVLQNGASVARLVKAAKKTHTLALTSRGGHDLSLPHYPLPDGRLEFLQAGHGHIKLIVDHQWEGFCTTKGVLHNIAKGEKGKRVQELHDGDYGSISCNDLRILVKVGPRPKPVAAPATARDPRFRGKFLDHFVRSKSEAIGLAIAAAASLVIFGGMIGGLARRPYSKPAKMSDINEDYMLTFVAPDHLKLAPEALQQNLDRTHYVRSVLEYYQSFTSAIMAYPGYDPRFLLPTTISSYQAMFAAARETIEAHIERQRAADQAQALVKDAGMPAIPAVLGETLSGSMLRVIDKIAILQDSLGRNLDAKRAIDAAFVKDPEYNWEEYRNVSASRDEKLKEYLSKAKPFAISSDEQLMYAEADRVTAAAQAKQPRASDARSSLSRRITVDAHRPVGMPPGVRFASFLSDADFLLLDEKLYHVQGSEYGPRRGKAPLAHEPLVGEIDPNLVERFIKQNRFQLQLCYELALRRNEGANGTMEWRWRIDSRGLISDVALLSTTIKDAKMQTCVHQKISNWRFPRPRRGSVEISYPFEFAPTKG